MKKAVVLLSGGLDSAVTLYRAIAEGFCCDCLIFDYGQRHRREIISAQRVASQAGAKSRVVKIIFPWKGSALLDKTAGIPAHPGRADAIPSTYVPARNIIFLSFAVSFAEAAGAGAVFIGAHAQDYSGYPDCRPEFFRAFAHAVRRGTKSGVRGRPVRIITPLINKKKSGIVRMGHELGVPFELTWSCYRGRKHPCGRCDSCYYRARGFEQAGLIDPLIKKI